MCETGHNNLTFTTVEQKIAWKYLEVYLRNSDFALNSLKQPILSILSIFQLLKNLKKQILQQTTVIMCKTGHNNLTFTTVEQKIAWKYLEVYLRNSDFALNSLKQPILSILSIFQLLKNLKKQILRQPTVNMCETGHNNLTFTTVEQKTGWECLEAYLRYSDFA